MCPIVQEEPMKPTALVLVAALIALALPLALPAQEKKDAVEMSVTGCFNKGSAEGYYVLTDEKTGKKLTVIGDARLLASGLYSLKYYQFDAPGCDRPSGSVSGRCCSDGCIGESCGPNRRRR